MLCSKLYIKLGGDSLIRFCSPKFRHQIESYFPILCTGSIKFSKVPHDHSTNSVLSIWENYGRSYVLLTAIKSAYFNSTDFTNKYMWLSLSQPRSPYQCVKLNFGTKCNKRLTELIIDRSTEILSTICHIWIYGHSETHFNYLEAQKNSRSTYYFLHFLRLLYFENLSNN